MSFTTFATHSIAYSVVCVQVQSCRPGCGFFHALFALPSSDADRALLSASRSARQLARSASVPSSVKEAVRRGFIFAARYAILDALPPLDMAMERGVCMITISFAAHSIAYLVVCMQAKPVEIKEVNRVGFEAVDVAEIGDSSCCRRCG